MTISSNVSKITHTGNGAATLWPYAFKIIEATDIKVYLTNTDTNVIVEITTGFTVTPNADMVGGSVTYPTSGSPLASNQKITLLRDVELTQEMDLVNQGPFYAETVEQAFDKITMIAQQLYEAITRAVQLPLSSTENGAELLAQILVDATAAAIAATNAAASAAAADASADLAAQYAQQAQGDASNVTITPQGGISSAMVDAAIYELDTEKLAKAGGTMTGALHQPNPVSITSASGVLSLTEGGNSFVAGGSEAITSIAGWTSGIAMIRWNTARTLTHNASSLILQNGTNRTTVIGDIGIYEMTVAGAREVAYFPATSLIPSQINNAGKFLTTNGSNVSWEGVGDTLVIPGWSISAPVDGETHYIGAVSSGTTESAARVYVPRGGTIKKAYYQWNSSGVAGSAENISVYLRINGSIEVLIATVGNTSAYKEFINTGLSINVNAGDYFCFKIVYPTWATNPTGIANCGCIYVE